jgi:cytochrome b6-f complex iron-sulfur subunit
MTERRPNTAPPPSTLADICRRTVVLAPLGYLAACTTTRWIRATRDPSGVISVPLAELSPEGYVYVETGGDSILLQRDAAGELSAVTLTCSHQGCTLSRRRDTLVCPCHGSRFDLQGAVLDGPATRPLVRYRVEVVSEMARLHVGAS